MVAENVQLTINLNSNNSQTNYLYMELFQVDDTKHIDKIAWHYVAHIALNVIQFHQLLRFGDHSTKLYEFDYYKSSTAMEKVLKDPAGQGLNFH